MDEIVPREYKVELEFYKILLEEISSLS